LPTSDLEGLGPRFRLESFVARGAWGAVYKGVDTETGAAVAVKRLHDFLCEPAMLERFEREARMLGSLHNPHVVRYVAHGHDAHDRPYLVLEWLEGEDLGAWRKGRGHTQKQVVELVRQAALGLAALHDAGIVHRDIKPSNFFLTGDRRAPTVVLIDLGIARTYADPALTAVGFLLGTPAYMSPEQARGQQRLTARSDLFSLGVVLFELITGKKPYRAEDMASLAMKIALQSPPRLREELPQVSRELDDLVATAMARAPEDRFASARELADALGRLSLGDDVLPSSARGLALGVTDEDGRRKLVVSESGASQGRGLSLSAIREQRVVTVLFARVEPTAEIDAALPLFQEVVKRLGGTFHDLLGPRRVAVFGGRGLPGDEAARAARAALAAATIPGLRLSLVTGQVVADDGSLSGGVLTRGLRELDRAREGIRLDEPTARLIEGRFAVEGARGDRLLRPVEGPEDFGSTLLGQAMPFLGRDRELAALLAMHEQCVAEPVARAVLLIGPAGAGKSRLRHELLLRLAAGPTPPVLLLGRGDPLGHGSPFGMLAGAIRGLAGLLDGEPLEQQRSKLEARLARALTGPALDRAAAFLGELCRVPFPAERAKGLAEARHTPMLMHDAMRAAFEEWVSAECARGPVLIAFDDLQWGDLPSVKFTDALLQALRDRPLFVLGSGRPEVHAQLPGLWAGRDVEEMRLGALTRKAAEKLVRHALGPEVTSEAVELAVDRAGGNPFFLEELIRALAEGLTDALPETVLGMVQARLDALGAPAKRLLRAASVFGQTFWLGGVLALLGDAEATPGVAAMLDQLIEAEIVVQRRSPSLPGETEYAFVHALVREAAHALLPDEDRAAGHRLAGAWLVARDFSDAAVLAEHFVRANESAQAVRWFARAAAQALEANDLAAALEHAERGLAAASSNEAIGQLRLIQAEALRFRGELAAAEERAAEAVARLAEGSEAWLRAAAELSAAAGLLGHLDRIEALARTLVNLPADPALRDPLVISLCRATIPLFWAGRPGSAPLFTRIDALAHPASSLAPQARALVHFSRATRALYAGRPGDHLLEQKASFQAFVDGADRRNAFGRQVALGFAYGELGLYAEAEAALREALTESERMGLYNLSVRAKNNLGNILCRRGALAEARVVEEQAVEACVAQGDPRLEAASRNYLAHILELAGDAEGALREARKAAELAVSTPTLRAHALGRISRLLLAAGQVAEALGAASDASALLESLGRIDEGESEIRLALAEALFAAGDLALGGEALRVARDRLIERASTIADPATRTSFLNAVAENEATLRLARAHGR
jgi:tetratricopeptide (TPR) repeat protein